jgi:hypothetical protein
MTFQEYSDTVLRYLDLGFSLDLSRMDLPSDLEDRLKPQIDKAFATGRAQFEKHLPFVRKMLSPIPRGEGIVDPK